MIYDKKQNGSGVSKCIIMIIKIYYSILNNYFFQRDIWNNVYLSVYFLPTYADSAIIPKHIL